MPVAADKVGAEPHQVMRTKTVVCAAAGLFWSIPRQPPSRGGAAKEDEGAPKTGNTTSLFTYLRQLATPNSNSNSPTRGARWHAPRVRTWNRVRIH